MTVKLVLVESPAKARTIGKILGDGYMIKATLGHVRDLPRKELGIDIANDFAPRYVLIQQRKDVIRELKRSVDEASAVYLATDPDREGEAISWHLVDAVRLDEHKVPIHRVVFHEITKEAVEKAFRHPRAIDMNLVDAQQARRLLDRLVGYKLSPLLWRKVQRGLSAGRVQSAALRIIVDREREIQNFIEKEYWTIQTELTKSSGDVNETKFRALLVGSSGNERLDISNREMAESVTGELRKASYSVKNLTSKDVLRQPAPPFITSTLQQEASRKLRFAPQRTMIVAQQLYEGVALGPEGSVGLITYMRTDSTHVAAGAIAETRDFVAAKYGERFLPSQPRTFGKRGKWAQEAHEAIRPTKIHRQPEQVHSYLKSEQFKLYELIWKRMVASQMASASLDVTTAEIEARSPMSQTEYLLRTSSSVVKFPGFMTVYTEGRDDDAADEKMVCLPDLRARDRLVLLGVLPEQHFTEPPPRYTEATLIKALEQKGIGRPSTYAPILSTIQERGYVHKQGGRIHPDEIGCVVNDLLTQHFRQVVDLDFTAKLEEELDEIARGQKGWVPVLKEFYTPFKQMLSEGSEKIERVRIAKPTREVCPDCGRPMVLKAGRFGEFLACTGYPECKKTMRPVVKTGALCPECGREVIQKVTKKKRLFYSCSGYPECRFATNNRPLSEPCPQCGKMLIAYRNNSVKCVACQYRGRLDRLEKIGVAA